MAKHATIHGENIGKRMQTDAKPSDETICPGFSAKQIQTNSAGLPPRLSTALTYGNTNRQIEPVQTKICSLSELKENAKRSLQSTTAGLPPRLKHRQTMAWGDLAKVCDQSQR